MLLRRSRQPAARRRIYRWLRPFATHLRYQICEERLFSRCPWWPYTGLVETFLCPVLTLRRWKSYSRPKQAEYWVSWTYLLGARFLILPYSPSESCPTLPQRSSWNCWRLSFLRWNDGQRRVKPGEKRSLFGHVIWLWSCTLWNRLDLPSIFRVS